MTNHILSKGKKSRALLVAILLFPEIFSSRNRQKNAIILTKAHFPNVIFSPLFPLVATGFTSSPTPTSRTRSSRSSSACGGGPQPRRPRQSQRRRRRRPLRIGERHVEFPYFSFKQIWPFIRSFVPKKSRILSVDNFPWFRMNFQLFFWRFFSSGFDSNRNNILKSSSSSSAANDKYENYNDEEEEDESDDELEEERRKRRARRQQRAAARGLAKNIERYINFA